jgi:uncharacterized protein YegJ (DUF2314 family)
MKRSWISTSMGGLVLLTTIAGCHKVSDPTIAVPENDPRVAAATVEAMAPWSEFTAAFESPKAGDHFAIKTDFREGNQVEWMWITVEKIEGAHVTGVVDNEPSMVKNVSMGQRVTIDKGRVADWLIIERPKHLRGGYSISVLEQIEKERK